MWCDNLPRLQGKLSQVTVPYKVVITHIAQNIVEIWQEYFLYFIAIEILSQHFCQILQNISSQHYNFNFVRYFWKQTNI